MTSPTKWPSLISQCFWNIRLAKAANGSQDPRRLPGNSPFRFDEFDLGVT